MSVCTYHTAGFTDGELDALEEYHERHDQLGLQAYFDPEEERLADADDLAGFFRERADKLTRWHHELTALFADPRLENERRRDNPYGPRYDERGEGPYCAAVARFLNMATEDYHRHRRSFEYAVTVWALGRTAPDTYPPDSRSLDLEDRALQLWG
ncbi:hypothetical protein [Actinacidiphila reveromycinica]|nr:hypothetical protein [Streptomyces sp. SN-593]